MNEGKLTDMLGLLVSRTLAPQRHVTRKNSLVHAIVVGIAVVNPPGGQCRLVQVVVETENGFFEHCVAADKLTLGTLREMIENLLERAALVPIFKKKRTKIFLVGFDTPALFSCIEDHGKIRLEQLGDVHSGSVVVEHAGRRWDLRFRQLTGFFPEVQPPEVAEQLGLASLLELEKEFSKTASADVAVATAARIWPAFVAVASFNRFRQTILNKWSIDPLKRRGLPAVAAEVFKKFFLKSGPARWTKRRITKKRKTKNGFRDESRRQVFFAGNQEVRVAAARSLWGGIMVANVRGFIHRPMVEFDAVSLYPTAALLQPLPNHRTRWEKLDAQSRLDDYEGFVRAEFEFPSTFPYPHLPVSTDGIERIVLPRSGETNCTVAELRLAKQFGAKVHVVDGWGFKPRDQERHHDVGRFMQVFLDEKKSAKKGTVNYLVAKLFLNALVGKFAERWSAGSILELEHQAHVHGLGAGIGVAVTNSPRLHRSMKSTPDAGILFAPEWASLILGRARAVMADIAANGALYVSTDAVLVTDRTDLSCDSLEQLCKVGGGLRREQDCDAAVIFRCRFYVLLKRPSSVKPTDVVFAANDEWAVVKAARHGSKETKQEFAETVLACLAAGKDVAPIRVRHRRLSADAAARTGMQIDSVVTEEHRTKFNWDFKRRLLDRDVNPFSSWSSTEPYASASAMQSAERQHRLAQRLARRRKKHPKPLVEEAKHLLGLGLSIRDVAAKTAIPKSTVSDLRQELVDEGVLVPLNLSSAKG